MDLQTSRKARYTAHATMLQQSTSIEADAIRELVDLMYEDAKEGLVRTSGDDMLRLQGEAQCLRRLYDRLTRSSPAVQPQG